MKFLKNPILCLILILILGFTVRLYKIDNPVADWHSWRQADTAAVSRNFYKEGFNPFIPKLDDMGGAAEQPVVNPGRYRFVEFPIYNSLVYFAYLIKGGVDERLARFVAIMFSLGSTVYLYLIVRRYSDEAHALLSALLYAILPFNIYFSRVILPEPSLVFFCLGMLYYTDLWIYKDTKKLYFLSLFFIACAFLTKPMAVFYMLPLVYSYYLKEGGLLPIPKRYFKLIVPALIPFGLWRIWMQQHPEGIPASNWLFNGNGIRFKPAFFKWIIGDRFGREILSVTGTFLFFLGLIVKPLGKMNSFLHLLTLSAFLYLIVFASGNVQHDYYQYLIVPALVIFLARGFLILMRGLPNFIPRLFTIPLGLLFLVLTIYFCWNEVKGLYQINNFAIVEAGREADKILPKDAVVIAAYNGDTAFLYQTNRTGFALAPLPTQEMRIRYNVSYYISTSKDAKTAWLMDKFTVVEANPDFYIIDITKPKESYHPLIDKEP